MGNPERTKFDSEPGDDNPIRIYSSIEPVINGLVKVANNIGKTTKFSDIYAVKVVPDQPIGAPVTYGLDLYGDEKHKARIGRAFHFIKPGLEKLYDTYHKDSIQKFYERLTKITFTFWRIIDRSERTREQRKLK